LDLTRGEDLPGPPPVFFFAPIRVSKRSRDWGPAGLEARVAEAWHPFCEWTAGWLEVVPGFGFEALRDGFLELLDGGPGAWDDAGNHERLVRAASEHGAEWLLGIDADERVERGFRERAERVIARSGGEGAYFVRIRELWDRPDRVRVDGVRGRKRKAALFRARPDHVFDRREWHGHWAPLNDHPDGIFPTADLLVYHLRMLHAEDRAARRARYEALDPEARWQQIGYAYLTSADGLVTAPLPYGRDYVTLPVSRSGPSRSSAPAPAHARRSPAA
jgi:hypothetical protein